MCGITGIIGPISGKYELIQKMNDALIHRGPDGSGIYISENQNVGFGHRRLSIIELSTLGAQPMHFINRYTITFNGEIYNYLEIKHFLQKDQHIFNNQLFLWEKETKHHQVVKKLML